MYLKILILNSFRKLTYILTFLKLNMPVRLASICSDFAVYIRKCKEHNSNAIDRLIVENDRQNSKSS
jgi:hypothetical protein